MDAALGRAIQHLRRLTVPTLKSRYRNILGNLSESNNKQFLMRRVAWQLQAQAEGDLSERTRSRAAEIADETDLRSSAPRLAFVPIPVTSSLEARAPRDGRLPPAGTVLSRRYQGRDILVRVLQQGFEWESKRYRSLSAIAREATGTRWNGLLFFGLTGRRNG